MRYASHMRTTVIFDPDVAAIVEAERGRGRSVSKVVNDLVRRGARASAPSRQTFTQSTSAMGRSRLPLDRVADALDALEGDARQ